MFNPTSLHRTALAATLTATGFCALAPSVQAQEAVAAGPMRSYSTYHSLGFEWDIAGDTNHNATVGVRYRKMGETTFKPALDLMRIDWQGSTGRNEKTGLSTLGDRPYNMLAGSVMFLQPGTQYEVELTMNDADNSAGFQQVKRVVNIGTRVAPRLNVNARRLYVTPGAKKGNGAEKKPFGTLADAQKAAKPGDIVMLGAGNYGQATLDKAGSVGNPIAYVAAPGVKAQFSQLNVNADNLWIDGLTFRPTDGDKGGLKANDTSSSVVVRGCDFDGFSYSIMLGWEAFNQNWTIVDNTMVGAKEDIEVNQEGGAFKGEGVELSKTTGGHVVAYNRISRVADGISYTKTNCDLFGNDIFDTSDDGIEMDFGYANNRAWKNRISNFHYHGISFQPVNSGPWYFVRNQVVSPRGSAIKFRNTHRFVMVGNTFAAPRFAADYMGHMYNGYTRNNLFLAMPGAQQDIAFSAQERYKGNGKESNTVIPDQWAPDWKTNVDFNGYGLFDQSKGFRFKDQEVVGLSGYKEKSGMDQHSRLVDRNAFFEDYPAVTNPAGQPYPPLFPNGASYAIDNGVVVYNLEEDYYGGGPDLGALEAGLPAPQYGPRNGYKLGDPLF